jgi:mRNA interferase MazF
MQSKENFDDWNEEKYMLHHVQKQIFAHEREVWLAKVWQNIGNEQNGKDQYLRPVLIYKKLCWVYCCIPLTTQWSADKSYHYKLQSF